MSEINTQRRATNWFVVKFTALIEQLGVEKAREEAERIMTDELTERPPAKYDKNDTLSWHNEHNSKVAKLAYDYKFNGVPLPIASDQDSIILEKVKKRKLLEARLTEAAEDKKIAELELQLKELQYEKEMKKDDKTIPETHDVVKEIVEEATENAEQVCEDNEKVEEILTTAPKTESPQVSVSMTTVKKPAPKKKTTVKK